MEIPHDLFSSFGLMGGREISSTSAGSSSSTSLRKNPTSAGGNSSYHHHHVPHKGALRRLDEPPSHNHDATTTATLEGPAYVIPIDVQDDTHVLEYTRRDFAFCQRLFSILDTESRGLVDRDTVQEFVCLRCPVFWRRDDDLARLRMASNAASLGDSNSQQYRHQKQQIHRRHGAAASVPSSPTFDEIWRSVAMCSQTTPRITSCLDGSESDRQDSQLDHWKLGVEGWIVFCRFIALAQYLEAKRRFSARHLQQTMRHRNSPRGSELIVVEVPPPEPPAPLSPEQLAAYEVKNQAPLPLPELDLDHSLLAAHDWMQQQHQRNNTSKTKSAVKIRLFGSSSSSSFSSNLLHASSGSKSASSANLEFAITLTRRSAAGSHTASDTEDLVVRRSMADMKWLDSTFTSHKVLGGTLCGRILPPFPGRGMYSSHFKKEDFLNTSSIKSTTGGAIHAAAASVGRIRDVAKSFFGSYLTSTTLSTTSSSNSSVGPSNSSAGAEDQQHSVPPLAHTKKQSSSSATKKKQKRSVNFSLQEGYYNPNSPEGKARQLERYLNYLLEHPALSTSFPLNTILKASQSGLEAAKNALDDCSRASQELKAQTPQLDDGGKTLISFWAMGGGTGGSSSSTSHIPNFPWVRTAAQAAMALRVHGMLETTGMKSASARLQHASLPSFGGSGARNMGGWADDEGDSSPGRALHRAQEETRETSFEKDNNFEDGVISVSSELRHKEETCGEDGYDLLPLPVPAPERTILNAGSDAHGTETALEGRFHYGTSSPHGHCPMDDEVEAASAYLGDVLVDENIDKLREVIGSVDNTLSRCLSSSCGIGKAQREQQSLHLDVVRGLDSWEGMRGRFVSQRSLLKGVAGIEQSKDLFEEGGLALVDNISWQTSLASAAVSAAEDVRSAVRVSRTATSAKAAANSAAFEAQHTCDTTQFATMEEARAAQTRASIAHSHAIHAAVVDHEAKTVKRRATLALANDVKCWNVHRKREMLAATIAYARSQHEATRRAVDAWSSLRDGFIDSTVIPSTHERRPIPTPPRRERPRRVPSVDPEEVTTTIFEDLNTANQDSEPIIVAVDHNLLAPSTSNSPEGPVADHLEEAKSIIVTESLAMDLPFATAAPIEEGMEESFLSRFGESSHTSNLLDMESSRAMNTSVMEGSRTSNALDQTTPADGQQTSHFLDLTATAETGSTAAPAGSHHSGAHDDKLTESMQSLVEGLMHWGGGFDADEDHFALPAGMAASIILEEGAADAPSASYLAEHFP